VLVHDAARPCLTAEDLAALIDVRPGDERDRQGGGLAMPGIPLSVQGTVNGAVLSSPIVDTVRRERGGAIETVDREGLWRALTPQVFRLGQLQQALSEALRSGVTVTDEAQAMERLGFPHGWCADRRSTSK
jgi:2-C-methyl-D-erythritol 4-phosphate cytidylyltransferase